MDIKLNLVGRWINIKQYCGGLVWSLAIQHSQTAWRHRSSPGITNWLLPRKKENHQILLGISVGDLLMYWRRIIVNRSSAAVLEHGPVSPEYLHYWGPLTTLTTLQILFIYVDEQDEVMRENETLSITLILTVASSWIWSDLNIFTRTRIYLSSISFSGHLPSK